MPRRRWIASAAAAGLLFALIPLDHAARAATPAEVGAILCSSQPSTVADFNGDKIDDIAVGAPGDGLEKKEIDGSITNAKPNAGSINIVYGGNGTGTSKAGLQPGNGPTGAPKFISQDSPGVVGGAHAGDAFGSSIAAGDFNHDGSPDLAVGAPGADGQAGEVHIFYGGGPANPGIGVGTPGTLLYNQVIKIGSKLRGTTVPGSKHPGDLFGWSLSTGDYNGDGYMDLAVGVPGYDVSGKHSAGAVLIIYGGPDGLNPAKSGGRPAATLLTLPGRVVGGKAGDFFGASLATGNFKAQGVTDSLAIGSPGADIGKVADAGAVAVVYGGPKGLALDQGPSQTVNGEGFGHSFRWFTENTDDIGGDGAHAGDRFGCSLAPGNFNNSAPFNTDLAIGAPGRATSATATNAGAVFVLYNAGLGYGVTAQPPKASALNCPGTPSSIVTCWTDAQMWTEDAGGIPGVSKKDDQFGASLYAADLNGDGAADLVIGVPNEKLYGNDGVGSIRVIFGFDKFGLTDHNGMAFAQRPSDMCTAEDAENAAVCANAPDYTEVGMVGGKGDHFGATLAVGDFNGDAKHTPDIVVGVPGESVGNTVNYLLQEVLGVPADGSVPLHVDDSAGAGALQVIYDVTAVAPQKQSTDVLYRAQAGLRTAIDALAAANGDSNGNGIIDDLAADSGGTSGAPGGGGGIGDPGLAATEPGQALSTAPLTGDHLGGALG